MVLLLPAKVFSQSFAINTDGSTADPSAILDVKSSTKGLLIPRLTTVQKLAIATPAEGLKIYDTDTKTFWFYNGTVWIEIPDGSNSWNLSGNTLSNPANQFIGTLDDNPLLFRINNINAGILDSTSQNTAFGYRALDSIVLTPLQFNTAFGYKTLLNNTTGILNTAIGGSSLRYNKTGDYNVAVGYASLDSNTVGGFNTAIGSYAVLNNTTGNYNTGIGYAALDYNKTGNYNCALGFGALFSVKSGENTAVGANALLFDTSSTSINTAVGYASQYFNLSGNLNTSLGRNSLLSNKTGSNNIAIGNDALYNSLGNNNTAVGGSALYLSFTRSDNTSVGYVSLFNNDGDFNTAVGSYSLVNLISGSRNIAVGYNSGNHPSTPNITNTISIGNEGILNAANNQAFLGNLSTLWNGGNKPWSTYSDARMKNNIKEDVKGLDFITRLKPVTYYRSIHAITKITGNKEVDDFDGKYDIEKIKESGFLAQDVEQAAKAAGYDFSGITVPQKNNQLYTLSYELFVVPLVKAVQEQQVIIEEQNKKIELLLKEIQGVKEQLNFVINKSK
jgi:hypothetical protein